VGFSYLRSGFEYVLSTLRPCKFLELLNRLCFIGYLWGGRRGSNPRHSVPQTDALPAELLPPLVGSLARSFGGEKGGVIGLGGGLRVVSNQFSVISRRGRLRA
jgi:hypothetical protein